MLCRGDDPIFHRVRMWPAADELLYLREKVWLPGSSWTALETDLAKVAESPETLMISLPLIERLAEPLPCRPNSGDVRASILSRPDHSEVNSPGLSISEAASPALTWRAGKRLVR